MQDCRPRTAGDGGAKQGPRTREALGGHSSVQSSNTSRYPGQVACRTSKRNSEKIRVDAEDISSSACHEPGEAIGV
jgi:hypothetical protein